MSVNPPPKPSSRPTRPLSLCRQSLPTLPALPTPENPAVGGVGVGGDDIPRGARPSPKRPNPTPPSSRRANPHLPIQKGTSTPDREKPALPTRPNPRLPPDLPLRSATQPNLGDTVSAVDGVLTSQKNSTFPDSSTKVPNGPPISLKVSSHETSSKKMSLPEKPVPTSLGKRSPRSPRRMSAMPSSYPRMTQSVASLSRRARSPSDFQRPEEQQKSPRSQLQPPQLPQSRPPQLPQSRPPQLPQSRPPQLPQSQPPSQLPQSQPPPQLPQSQPPPQLPQSQPPRLPQSQPPPQLPQSRPPQLPQSQPPSQLPQSQPPPQLPQSQPPRLPQSRPPQRAQQRQSNGTSAPQKPKAPPPKPSQRPTKAAKPPPSLSSSSFQVISQTAPPPKRNLDLNRLKAQDHGASQSFPQKKIATELPESVMEHQKTLLNSDEAYTRDIMTSITLFQGLIRQVSGPNVTTMLFDQLSVLLKFHARTGANSGNLQLWDSTLRLFHGNHLYESFFNNYHKNLLLMNALEADSFFHAHLQLACRPSSLIVTPVSLQDLLQSPVQRVEQYALILRKIQDQMPPQHKCGSDLSSALGIAENLHNSLANDPKKQPDDNSSPAVILSWLMKNNSCCADCDSTSLEYLSTTLPALLCASCAHIHQSALPRYVSIVEPVTPESFSRATSWCNNPKASDIVLMARSCSNLIVNSIWEQSLPSEKKPTSSSSVEKKTSFIVTKYLQRAYYHRGYGYVVRVQEKKQKGKWNERFLRFEESQGPGEAKLVINSSVENFDSLSTIPLSDLKVSFVEEEETYLQLMPARLLIDAGSRYRLLTLLFALHRRRPKAMETSFFHLTQWLDTKGWFVAVERGQIVALKEYLSVSPTYCCVTTANGQTAAHVACETGRLDIALALLENGADFLARNHDNSTPAHELFRLCWTEDDLSRVTEFLEKVSVAQPNITFNETTTDQQSLLQSTILHSRGLLVPFLLSKGVNLDLPDVNGMTPFLLALTLHMKEVTILLMEAGADLFLRSINGEDSLTLAGELGDEQLYQRIFERHEERRITQTKNIVQELHHTENSFLKQIETLVVVFKAKMAGNLGVSERAIQFLFADVEDIFKMSQKFFSDLEGLLALPHEQRDVGVCFLKHISYFESYVKYCSNQTISSKTLNLLLTQSSIHSWITNLYEEGNEDGVKEKIEGYLIKPVQRICRYPLLLRELIKYSDPNSSTHPALLEADQKLGEIVTRANEQKRQVDHIEEIFNALSSQGVQFSCSSFFHDEGMIYSVSEKGKLDCKYYLFSDVWVVVNGEYPSSPIVHIFLFQDISFSPSQTESTAFEVVRQESSKKNRFICPSPEMRDQLIRKWSHILETDAQKLDEKQQDTFQRSIFEEEIFADKRKLGREKVVVDPKLARRVGLGEGEDSSILQSALNSGENLRTLRQVLEKVSELGEPPKKVEHSFRKHHFRSPRWCEFCNRFIYGLTYQGNKCKTCSYSAHFNCSKKVGKTCLSPLPQTIWRKRTVNEIFSVSYRKNSEEPQNTTLLLFGNTLEILPEHEVCVGKQKQRFLYHWGSIVFSLDVSVSVEGGVVTVDADGLTHSFEFSSREEALSCCEKFSSFMRRSVRTPPTSRNRKNAQYQSKSMRSSSTSRKSLITTEGFSMSISGSTDSDLTLSDSSSFDIHESFDQPQQPSPLSQQPSPLSQQPSQSSQQSQISLSSSQSPQQEQPQQENQKIMTVAFEYTATQETEMDLKFDQKIIILQRDEDWTFGTSQDDPDQSGWFPSDYVE